MTRQNSRKPHVAASPPPPARTLPPPPAPQAPPASVSVQNHTQPSLLRTMAEGMAFGTGSSLARIAAGRILDSPSPSLSSKSDIIEPEVYKTKTKCDEMLHDLDSCFHSEFACDDILQKYLSTCTSSNIRSIEYSSSLATDKYASSFL